MASVINRPDGHKWIKFFNVDGKRQTIKLGKANSRTAAEVCRRVELLLEARIANTACDRQTAEWLADVGDKLRDRLAYLGLIDKPADKPAATTLDAFLSEYMSTRSDIKPSTRLNLELTRRSLVNYFGADKPLSAITPGDADEWRLWLRRSKPSKPGEPMPPGLGENTARRTCGRAKQFFKAAKKKHLVAESPFAEIGDCQVRANKSRDRFVTQDEAKKVLEACPNAQWRLVFALSRFGGLRCPSEHATLRWSDIDWANNRFTVHSPKTEHHEGKESRVVPIFPELRPYLEAAWAQSPKNADYVFTLKGMVRNRLTGKSANVGTTMAKIVKKAGLTPWPKLFHNLRASRQTELAATFPEHVVCQWIGNSKAVAREHYLRVTEADFQRACKPASGTAGEPKSEPQGNQNRNQQVAAPSGTLGHVIRQVLEAKGLGEIFPEIHAVLLRAKAPPVGLEIVKKTQGKRDKSGQSASKSASVAEIATACRKLPGDVLAGVLALVRACG